MKFSNNNYLLSLQEKHGKFWVDKINTSKAVFGAQLEEIKGNCYSDWNTYFSKYLRDVFNSKNFANLHFSNKVVEASKKMISIKSFEALKMINDSFGAIIVNSKQSYLFGAYHTHFVVASIINDEIDMIEYLDYSSFSKGEFSYSTCMANFIRKANEKGVDIDTDEKDIMSIVPEVLPLIILYHFAEIETKVIQQGSIRKAVLNNEKYVNESKSPVKIIDSNWFTTIIKSEGFNVNGHFRLQPCGDGMKDRKLIWINPFEKQGYTRIARKELSKVA